jgi:protein-arginine kinase activator protein McsA
LALKLAVDAGEYERAAVVLDELRRTTNRVGIVQREGKP